MAYHPRIESKELATFITTRTRNSELWFANNKPVEDFALALLAKVVDRYGILLYAFGLEGSHYHDAIKTPLENRASFARDFNSGLATGVARLTPNYPGGKLWERRYSGELIAGDADIEAQFFYTVLQPVKDGLVEKISEYPGYNCFHDAVCGITRKYKLVNWSRYNAARKRNSNTNIKDYIEEYQLSYQRLPGYENLTQHEYRILMEKKLEEHRQRILKERRENGKNEFVGAEILKKVPPGSRAQSPKNSNINTHRPRVLSICNRRRAEIQDWYFDTYFKFKHSSKRYMAGELEVEFPPGMYRPPMWMAAKPAGEYSLIN